ncbi:MAG: PTS sugar transporter subunit IIA [Verrucomicrobia bacterium]|nr:PTS sugar transporter subunit IIA [Verrucomicrobiota bacterium]
MPGSRAYLTAERAVRLKANTKAEALDELIDLIAAAPQVHDRNTLWRGIHDRESIMSTGIGVEIAVPHTKLISVEDFVIAVGIAPGGIEWDAIDGKPVRIVVMIAGPTNRQEDYLRLLSRVVLLLKNPSHRQRLQVTESAGEIAQFFHRVG